MRYQDDLLAIGNEILGCPHYAEGGACWRELADVSNGVYKHGPEIGFVGDNYGQPRTPRILLTRVNPIWDQKSGWFGTLESLREYRMSHPSADAREVFRHYLEGWKNDRKEYCGLLDAGTVTGRQNRIRLCGRENRPPPVYGVQLIMEEMIRAGVFPAGDGSPLRFCAINNVIKCAGSGKSSNPGRSMRNRCDYYRKELDTLAPHILVAFGGKTHRYLKKKLTDHFATVGNQMLLSLPDGAKCYYFEFPHPSQLGRKEWRGATVSHLRPASEIDRELGPEEEKQFKSGPDGSSTSTLFKYTLFLVSEAQRLKESILAGHATHNQSG